MWDKVTNENTGSLVDWKITLWGEVVDPEKATLHPLPGDYMNQTHPIHDNPFTSSAQVHTTTLTHLPTSEAPLTTPTDHPNRPVNSKTTLATGIVESRTATTSPSSTESPIETGVPDAVADMDDRPGFIPSFFPTFGVSGKTQAWIYGALVIIVFFIVGVACFLCMQRRKRHAKSSDYEFAVLEDEDDGAGVMTGGSNRRAGGAAGGRRKARELYDAFGASDDEDEMESYSDDEEKEYRDARDYELEQEEAARGIDEGKRVLGGDREALLGRNRV